MSDSAVTNLQIDLRGIDQLPSGHYRLRKQINKRKVEKIFQTAEEAVDVRDAIESKLAKRAHVLIDRFSIVQLGPEFMRTRESNRAFGAEKGRWDNHICKASFATESARSVEAPAIYGWLDELKQKETGYKNRPNQPLSWQSRKHCLNLLRAFFEFARRRGYVDSNPCAGIKVERDNDSEDEGWSPYWYLDGADQPRFLDACVEAGKEEAALPQFALGTGLRLNEQWCLHLTDLHNVGGRPCSCAEQSAEPHVVVRFGSWDPKKRRYRSPKGKKGEKKKPRIVPLFGLALQAVKKWLPVLAKRKNRYGLLFASPRGGRRTKAPKWFTKTVSKTFLVPRLGRRIWWHLLRHSCASSLVNGWWPGGAWSLNQAQKMLGRSSVKVTERYAHLTDKALQEVATHAQDAWVASCHAVVMKPENAEKKRQNSSPSKPRAAGSSFVTRVFDARSGRRVLPRVTSACVVSDGDAQRSPW